MTKKYIIRLSFSFEIFCFSSFLLFWPPAALLCVQRQIYKLILPPKPGLLSHSQKGCSWNGAYCTLCTIQRSHFLSEPRSPKEKNIILINGSDMCYPFFYLFIFWSAHSSPLNHSRNYLPPPMHQIQFFKCWHYQYRKSFRPPSLSPVSPIFHIVSTVNS